MRTIEDGDLAGGHAFVLDEGAGALEDEIGLLAVVDGLDDEGFLAVLAGGAEFLVEVAALGLGLEHAVGELENLRGRAVVGLDAVDDGAGVALLERHEVLEVGAAPRVDALGVVAHGHDAVVRGEGVHDLGLDRVGVLVFVHEHVAETLGEIGGDVGGLFEQVEPEFEQVVVVENGLGAFFLGVSGGERREQVLDLRILRKVALDGLGEGFLGVAREGENAEERTGLGVGFVLKEQLVFGFDDLLEERLGFVGVEDGEVFG